MLFSVFAVMGAVGGKVPLSLFNNHSFKTYLHHLNPKHRRPHRLERNRILEVMIDFAQLEFKKIVDERRNKLGCLFLFVTTYFWTESFHKVCFGALIADIITEKYKLKNDTTLFMSRMSLHHLFAMFVLSPLTSSCYISFLMIGQAYS